MAKPVFIVFGRVAIAAIAAALALVSASAARAEIKVVATIKPVHSLVALVMGATGAPALLVGGNASPHTFVMKPSDAAKLTQADILFRVSDAVEPFTLKAGKLLPKTGTLVTLQSAPGIVSLARRVGGPFDAHDAHEAHEHDHDHDDAHASVDGHIWLDPANARAMIDAIATALSAKAPANAATYAANATTAKARLDRLAGNLQITLAGTTGKPYVVFHDAYQYFEKRFGLNVVGSITVNPDIPPSGKRLALLRAKIAKLGATCVFGEPNFDAKVIAAVTEGSTARTGTLDPEGAALTPGPDLYETLMLQLATALKACLLSPS